MDEKSRLLGKLTDEYVQQLFTSRLYTPIVVTTAGKLEGSLSKDDDELFERLQKRLENEHCGTDYTALKGVVFDRFEIIRESFRNDHFSYGGMFGDPWGIRMNLALPFAKVREAFERLAELKTTSRG